MTPNDELLAMCERLMKRMDIARSLLRKGPESNWGCLDTTIDKKDLTELKRRIEQPSDGITCPFCGESGYDRVGLYRHLITGLQLSGTCEALATYEEGDNG